MRTGIQILQQSNWEEWGAVLTNGPVGSWDARLHGMISPCSVVKKDGMYYLYFIGADGDRSTDGGPRHRALGVATSSDGIHFTKYVGNPVLTYLPHDNEEEGVFSAGATLDENNNVVLYYGAMDAGTPTSTSVVSDVRVAVSNNGVDFADLGEALSHADSSVWGYGDELFPVGTFRANGQWYVYYIAKGRDDVYWDLGLAWGSSKGSLSSSQAVLTGGSFIIGGGDPVWIGLDRIALFLVRDFDQPFVEARTASISSPGQLSELVEMYDFGSGWGSATLFLDRGANTWFMYQMEPGGNAIHVRTAPSAGYDGGGGDGGG